ncbi:MAG: TnpV protein [Eubacterium sp.]|nr:TnpV protein [Eubacterium sp.]
MKDEFIGKIGVWGQRRYNHLKATKPSVVNVMRMNKNLIPYLQSVDEQADEMFFQLVKQIAKKEGITEQLKQRDQMAWVREMNGVRNRAIEIVTKEIINI